MHSGVPKSEVEFTEIERAIITRTEILDRGQEFCESPPEPINRKGLLAPDSLHKAESRDWGREVGASSTATF